jgi:hypothetical protein
MLTDHIEEKITMGALRNTSANFWTVERVLCVQYWLLLSQQYFLSPKEGQLMEQQWPFSLHALSVLA